MGALSDLFRSLPMVEMRSEVEARNFTTKDGKSRTVRGQVAYLVQIDQYGEQVKRRIRVDLGTDGAPYAVGLHILDGDSLEGNNYGDLALRRYGVKFRPVSPQLMALIEQDSKRVA